jgi:hypothetical protein
MSTSLCTLELRTAAKEHRDALLVIGQSVEDECATLQDEGDRTNSFRAYDAEMLIRLATISLDLANRILDGRHDLPSDRFALAYAASVALDPDPQWAHSDVDEFQLDAVKAIMDVPMNSQAQDD